MLTSDKIIMAGKVAPVAVLLGCVAIGAGVITDSTPLQVLGAILLLAAFVVMLAALPSVSC